MNFTSLVGFSDVHGATIGTEYISERTGLAGTPGWATHGITPMQDPFPLFGGFVGLDPNYDGEMSEDLSHGVYRAYRPITDDPDVTALINLYVRDDLRTPGDGFYRVITDPGFPPPATGIPVRPYLAGASGDFSHIIFESNAQLLSRDPLTCSAGVGGDCPVQLYEWSDGTLRLAGVLPDGTPAPSSQTGQGAFNNGITASTPRMISEDGSRIFFQAPAGGGNVYMRVNGATTVQLNVSEKSVRPRESPQNASLWIASRDGSRVFFSTDEGLVDGDDDGAGDYYMYDVNAPVGQHLALISRDGNAGDVDGVLGVVGASDDGHYLYFTMSGQIVAGEPQLDGQRGLYVWHDGVVRYIGYFINPDDSIANDLHAWWGLISTTLIARVAADGSHVTFATRGDGGFRGRWGFAGYDHGTACNGGCSEIYVFDANADRLRCASCDPSGTAPTGAASVNTKLDSYSSAVNSTSHITHALSNDGRYAFFNSPDPLVPEDTNGRIDAYEYDSVTETVHLLSSGRSSDDSYFMDASGSGRDAFFVTRERLVGWDTDSSFDLYDARVGGGMPEPIAPPPPCTGEGCHGSGSAFVLPDVSASRGFEGTGDLRERLRPHRAKHRRCKHGTRRIIRRGKVRCVRRKAHRGRRAVRLSIVGGVER